MPDFEFFEEDFSLMFRISLKRRQLLSLEMSESQMEGSQDLMLGCFSILRRWLILLFGVDKSFFRSHIWRQNISPTRKKIKISGEIATLEK